MTLKSNLDNDRFFTKLVKEGYLTISDSGVVKNNYTGRLIGAVGSGQYKKISVRDPSINKNRHIQVHRLVYLIYYGPIEQDIQINHIDANKLNNHISNLETVTPKENSAHAKRLGLLSPPKGERNGNSIFSDEQVIQIRELHSNGKSLDDLSLEFGTNWDNMYQLVSGRSYRHLNILYKIRGRRAKNPNSKKYIYHDQIMALYREGLSCYKIADRVKGVSRATIDRVIRENNVQKV